MLGSSQNLQEDQSEHCIAGHIVGKAPRPQHVPEPVLAPAAPDPWIPETLTLLPHLPRGMSPPPLLPGN